MTTGGGGRDHGGDAGRRPLARRQPGDDGRGGASRAGPVRPARRRRVPLIGLAVLLLPVLELVVAVQVGQLIGTGWTALLVLAGCALGVVVLRRVGLAAVRLLGDRGQWSGPRHAGPAGPVGAGAGAALLGLAGVLLLVPGLLTDAVGLVLLLPPVRAVLGRRLASAVQRRVVGVVNRRVIRGETAGPTTRPTTGPADVIQVEVVEVRDVPPTREPGAPPH